MRTFVHTFVAFFLAFGLVVSSMAQVSALQMKGGMMQAASVSGQVEIATQSMGMPTDMEQKCIPGAKMAGCPMEHSQRVAAGMGCFGCLLSGAELLTIDPLENRMNGFAVLDVTGKSRAQISLLKPPRA